MSDKPKRKPKPHLLSWRAAVLWLAPFVWIVALLLLVHYVPIVVVLLISAVLTGVMVWDWNRPYNDATLLLGIMQLWLIAFALVTFIAALIVGASGDIGDDSMLPLLPFALAYLIPPVVWGVGYTVYQWTRFVWRQSHG